MDFVYLLTPATTLFAFSYAVFSFSSTIKIFVSSANYINSTSVVKLTIDAFHTNKLKQILYVVHPLYKLEKAMGRAQSLVEHHI